MSRFSLASLILVSAMGCGGSSGQSADSVAALASSLGLDGNFTDSLEFCSSSDATAIADVTAGISGFTTYVIDGATLTRTDDRSGSSDADGGGAFDCTLTTDFAITSLSQSAFAAKYKSGTLSGMCTGYSVVTTSYSYTYTRTSAQTLHVVDTSSASCTIWVQTSATGT